MMSMATLLFYRPRTSERPSVEADSLIGKSRMLVARGRELADGNRKIIERVRARCTRSHGIVENSNELLRRSAEQLFDRWEALNPDGRRQRSPIVRVRVVPFPKRDSGAVVRVEDIVDD
jgi:hypothetical protein